AVLVGEHAAVPVSRGERGAVEAAQREAGAGGVGPGRGGDHVHRGPVRAGGEGEGVVGAGAWRQSPLFDGVAEGDDDARQPPPVFSAGQQAAGALPGRRVFADLLGEQRVDEDVTGQVVGDGDPAGGGDG